MDLIFVCGSGFYATDGKFCLILQKLVFTLPNPTPHGGRPRTANTALSVGKQMEPIENSSLSFVLLRNSVRMQKHPANKVVKKRKKKKTKPEQLFITLVFQNSISWPNSPFIML